MACLAIAASLSTEKLPVIPEKSIPEKSNVSFEGSN